MTAGKRAESRPCRPKVAVCIFSEASDLFALEEACWLDIPGLSEFRRNQDEQLEKDRV